MAERVEIRQPAGLGRPISPYAHVVRVGDHVYVSGQVARDANDNLVGKGDVVAQARKALENVRTCLAAVGATMDHVVKVTVYLTNVDDRPKIVPVREEFFPNTLPASTLVEVSRLVSDDLLVEIEAIAVVSP